MSSSVMSLPSRIIFPESGFSSPAIILASVVLPPPFGPVITTSLLSGTSRSIPRSTCTSPGAVHVTPFNVSIENATSFVYCIALFIYKIHSKYTLFVSINFSITGNKSQVFPRKNFISIRCELLRRGVTIKTIVNMWLMLDNECMVRYNIYIRSCRARGQGGFAGTILRAERK